MSETQALQLKRNRVSVEGGTAILALAGDKVNALDREVLDEIPAFVDYCEQTPEITAVGADRRGQVLLGRTQRE